MSIKNLKYQTIRDWEGKIKKITQKDFVETTGNGQYHPPEGALVFQDGHSDVAYFVGGARHKKPAHWNMADTMFRVTLTQLDDKKTYSIGSFELINHSVSKTSSAPKLAFASALTIEASKSKLLAFSVNGKSLDLREQGMSLSNEIHIYETMAPLYTTYRTTTIRTPDRARQVPVLSKRTEILQLGSVPPAMYASTITSLRMNKPSKGVAVLVGGNKLSNVDATPIQIMMGLKDFWKEESSGAIYTLNYDLDESSFIWEKISLQISPRAHHSTMIVGYKLYIFGGTDYTTELRHDIRPLVIDTVHWIKLICIVEDDFPDKFLSGHGFLQIDDNRCVVVGGYNTLIGREKDIPTDELIQITVDEQEKVTIETLALGSGPIAQSLLINTPEEDQFILAGGTHERWALISNHVAPAVPCALNQKKKCVLMINPETYIQDTVNWLGCDGPCDRWFHIPCVRISPEEFVIISKRKKWFCNMSDSKK